MMTLEESIRKLIVFAADEKVGEIPSFYRDALLNYLAVTYRGAKENAVSVLSSYCAEDGKGYQPLGRDESVSLSDCALIDCFSSAILAYDDIHFTTTTHPCGPIASALLALCRKQEICLHDFLEALCIGMEVECRIAQIMFTHETKGWYTTGIAGGIGAAAGVGRLLHLNGKEMENAMSLAASYASGIRGTHGSMAGSYVPAIAAKNGYTAASLAKKGFTCNVNALSGKLGLIYQVTDQPAIEEGMKDLGKRFISMETSCKPYPYGFISFGAIEACMGIPKCDKIDTVIAEVSERCALLGSNPYPDTIYEAFVSLPYIIAKGLRNPESLFEPLPEKIYLSNEEKEEIQKVEIRANSSFSDDEIQLTQVSNHNTTRIHVKNPLGSTLHPMSHEEMMKKINKLNTLDEELIQGVLTEDGQKRISINHNQVVVKQDS